MTPRCGLPVCLLLCAVELTACGGKQVALQPLQQDQAGGMCDLWGNSYSAQQSIAPACCGPLEHFDLPGKTWPKCQLCYTGSTGFA